MERLKYEIELLNKGIKHIAGVDEAGRGPLAGPLVVAAVILDIEKIVDLHFQAENTKSDVPDAVLNKTYEKYAQIRDSKLLSEKKRCDLEEFITNEAISYSVVEIDVDAIDREGIGNANQSGFFQAINKLGTKPNYILTDHFEIHKITKEHQQNITKGDNKSITIAAASILAKQHRDKLMRNAHKMYPIYDFTQHKGYGTKRHRELIKEHGPCALHRKSFEPVKSMLANL
jgi:ribonuclease HII